MEYDMNINWFAVTIISFWTFACLASIITKDTEPFGAALVASCIFGIGYFLYKAKL